MIAVLVVGAGITGGYIAARLYEHGLDVELLAQGESAVRFAQEGLRLRDGITGEAKTLRLPIVRETSIACGHRKYALVLVCVQEQQRVAAAKLVAQLQGRPVVWFLGNTVRGFDELGHVLGRDRVLGGFPGVGGRWEGSELVFADRRTPEGRPFHDLVIGEAWHAGREACRQAQRIIGAAGFKVRRYQPIIAWQLCHAVLILPLAGLFYQHGGVLAKTAADREGLRQVVRAVAQGCVGYGGSAIRSDRAGCCLWPCHRHGLECCN
ncbi:2-dehydropantoate 2-reductase N-terminal domain-containing protein [Aquisalimonas sp.]|uniref:ketopantoate reductase family protein n=1 Tax=Aquisalimonas sp. TaxID=1872621 RepID=UPI0025BDCCC8|nr:2-dehydropantoate 2-reductase N-terminal domain-containing protein [Aquisalimonas sp.]